MHKREKKGKMISLSLCDTRFKDFQYLCALKLFVIFGEFNVGDGYTCWNTRATRHCKRTGEETSGTSAGN